MDKLQLQAIVAELNQQKHAIERLKTLRFTDPAYKGWRMWTGQLLDRAFRDVDGETHPWTKAFMNYDVPEFHKAGIAEMQDYYHNILQYQADLLSSYVQDLQVTSLGSGRV